MLPPDNLAQRWRELRMYVAAAEDGAEAGERARERREDSRQLCVTDPDRGLYQRVGADAARGRPHRTALCVSGFLAAALAIGFVPFHFRVGRHRRSVGAGDSVQFMGKGGDPCDSETLAEKMLALGEGPCSINFKDAEKVASKSATSKPHYPEMRGQRRTVLAMSTTMMIAQMSSMSTSSTMKGETSERIENTPCRPQSLGEGVLDIVNGGPCKGMADVEKNLLPHVTAPAANSTSTSAPGTTAMPPTATGVPSSRTGMAGARTTLPMESTPAPASAPSADLIVMDWQVASEEPAVVRSRRDPDAEVLGEKRTCVIMRGREEGNWVELLDGKGYVQIVVGGARTLKRIYGYQKIMRGTCDDIGWMSITDPRMCAGAAIALGLSGTSVDIERPANAGPKGCYTLHGRALRSKLEGAPPQLCALLVGPVQQCRSTATASTTTMRGAGDWQVVSDRAVPLRTERAITSAILGYKHKCAVVQGVEDRGWIELSKESAFIKIDEVGGPVLRRLPRYSTVSSGTCHDAGAYPILDPNTCVKAAGALGLPDAVVSVMVAGAGDAPEGCFWDEKAHEAHRQALWVATGARSAGNGAGVARQPICSTLPGPEDRCAAPAADAAPPPPPTTLAPTTTTPGAVDWEVTFGKSVPVRRSKDLQAEILGTRAKCTVVRGYREGGWMRLLDGPGYMRIALGGTVLLKEIPTYHKLPGGKGPCTGAGWFPIGDPHTCAAAAQSLGLPDTTVDMTDSGAAPAGCYRDTTAGRPSLRLATGPENGGGAGGELEPICSTSADPMDMCHPVLTTSTTTRTATSGSPSLFCVSVLRPAGYEPGLVRAQFEKRAGVFACDDHALLSNETLALGPIRSIKFAPAPVGVSKDGIAGNTLLFMHAWDAVRQDGRFRRYDWTAKVDPDAVLLPDRLRRHLLPHTPARGRGLYVKNCDKHPDSPSSPAMLGALEALSRGALEAYYRGGARCRGELRWHGWGEDFFMARCLDLLEVDSISDFSILGDERCQGVNCYDGTSAAYHHFKTADSWLDCLEKTLVDG